MTSSTVHAQFSAYSADLLDFQDRRERLIKSSRDITTASKRLIFLLHRFPCSTLPYGAGSSSSAPKVEGNDGKDAGNEERESKRVKQSSGASGQAGKKAKEVMEEAVKRRDEIVKMLVDAATREGLSPWSEGGASINTEEQAQQDFVPLDVGQRADRYERPIGPGLEEMIEALSFMHFLETGDLISPSQLQHFFNDKEGKPIMPIPTQRYLLGLSDLTGELMRFATNAIGSGEAGSIDVVRSTLALMRDIKDALEPFTPLIRDMRKKQQVTTQSVRKIEDVLYAIAVRSSEYGSDPAALQEMVRRAMASSSGGGDEGRDED